MKQPELANGVLGDVVQKTIASLEHGKERISVIGENARRYYWAVTTEIDSLQQQLRAQQEEFDGLEKRAHAARRRIAELSAGGSPDLAALSGAIEELAEACAELRVAREREKLWLRHLESLRMQERSLGDMAKDGASLADEISTSIEFLATSFRELGSTLDNAQQSRALGLHVIKAQEEERRRLAREIHDGPTQLLNSVVLRIDVCQRLFDSDLQRLRDELQQLKELVRLSLQDVRKIIFDLRPMTLDDLGLIPALRTFLKDYQAKTGIETDMQAYGNDRRYDSTFEVAVFRIVQEALTNVLKHAGATKVWVVVDSSGNQIRVSVRDDGQGFQPDRVQAGVAGTRFGLVAMRERAELLGGQMELQSAPGQGTRLSFVFPLAE